MCRRPVCHQTGLAWIVEKVHCLCGPPRCLSGSPCGTYNSAGPPLTDDSDSDKRRSLKDEVQTQRTTRWGKTMQEQQRVILFRQDTAIETVDGQRATTETKCRRHIRHECKETHKVIERKTHQEREGEVTRLHKQARGGKTRPHRLEMYPHTNKARRP